MNKFRTDLIGALVISIMSASIHGSAHAGEMTEYNKAASEITHEGVWTKKSFKATGEWTIYTEGERTFVKLSADFKTRNAPDLKLFLSPRSPKELNGKNATNGSLLIAPLDSNKGEQIYEIPAGTDLAQYQSIIIHCEAYSKLWVAADLSATTA